jgi:hypothetical protein
MLRAVLPGLYQRLWFAKAWQALRKKNRYRADLPLGQQLRLLRRGFFPVAGHIYQLDGDHKNDYVTDYERFTRTPGINGRDAFMLDSKLAFFQMLNTSAPHLLPRHLAFFKDGQLVPTSATSRIDTVERLLDAMAELGTTIVKPTLGGGGSSIHRVHHEGGVWRVDGQDRRRADVIALIGCLGDAMVMELVQQSAYAADIYSGSTNTLRMLTMRPRGEPAFLAAVAHRFGTALTAPADNWTQGGLSCAIDRTTGALGPGAIHPSVATMAWLDNHPDTGARITGTIVPSWSDVEAAVVELADRVPLHYVGWDVVVTDGGPVILEGNRFSELGLLQVHRPLLVDPRISRFYSQVSGIRR